MKFTMIEKGYEYHAENGVVIKKDWQRVAVTNTGYACLDKYVTKGVWYVLGLKADNGFPCVYVFDKLAEAKAYITRRCEVER
jgi:hypothetical protein